MGEVSGDRPVRNTAAAGLGDDVPAASAPEILDAELAQPKWGTRADSPGPRGCWALTKAGRSCAAAVRADGDFCNAHSGIGVAANPAEYAPVGQARSAELRRQRADLRLVLGSTRRDSPRGALRAVALLNAERLASSTIGAALDPSVPVERRARLALDIIEAVDPAPRTELRLSTDLSPEAVDNLSWGELQAVAESHGLLPESSAPRLDEQPESA